MKLFVAALILVFPALAFAGPLTCAQVGTEPYLTCTQTLLVPLAAGPHVVETTYVNPTGVTIRFTANVTTYTVGCQDNLCTTKGLPLGSTNATQTIDGLP